MSNTVLGYALRITYAVICSYKVDNAAKKAKTARIINQHSNNEKSYKIPTRTLNIPVKTSSRNHN